MACEGFAPSQARAQAGTWWLTGLSGAGKTTLAQALAQALRLRGEPTCVIDGDELRAGLCQDLGFDDASRAENVRRAAHMAQLLNANGVHAVVALISPAAEARARAYATIGPQRCTEIHVSTPLAVCEQRDAKGLYARARSAQLAGMTGVQAPYEPPHSPALRIDTSVTPLHDAVQQLLKA
ncbi:MAG TPA: adenylyl-sulfate kinase [Comamonadaceae bacterium]|uniref:adenylyl-sulfate kinase n=1 Tax=Pulveribacter sp. TaxID=2678893 RepID=UPI000EBC256A|nr:adenylyl-sulfate kinase [Pulveribacter sp.]HCL87314.1 adenylyl-sulfate kinase [Comamonadaceae bacterium]